jgi:hypothetical protein
MMREAIRIAATPIHQMIPRRRRTVARSEIADTFGI